MTIADTRRQRLRDLIDQRYAGVARQLALAAKRAEGQINDMLATPPRKSFGERVARSIEDELGLSPGYLDEEKPNQTSAYTVREPGPAIVKTRAGNIAEIVATLPDNSPILDAIELMLNGAKAGGAKPKSRPASSADYGTITGTRGK